MRFTPKTENEIASEGLLPIGIYDFEIEDAEETTSKAGNDMIKLKVRVTSQISGEQRVIFDYLMEAMAFKLRHACEACDLLDDYEAGELDANDFVYKTGACKVSVQKDKTGAYPDRNVISDYIVSDEPQPKQEIAKKRQAKVDLDDDIPF